MTLTTTARTTTAAIAAGALTSVLALGSASAQEVILIPQPGAGTQAQGAMPVPGSGGRFILVPVPQERGPATGPATEPAIPQAGGPPAASQPTIPGAGGADAVSPLARELYRRGYERGMAEAAHEEAASGRVDPAEVERIGRELFERGYLLGLLQGRVQRAAGQAGGGAAETAAGGDGPLVQPGQYEAGPVTATYREDGSFKMSLTGTDRTVRGDYTVEGNEITLEDAIGDVGWTDFPLTCRAVPVENGFRLEEDVEGCDTLVGLEFRRQGSVPPKG